MPERPHSRSPRRPSPSKAVMDRQMGLVSTCRPSRSKSMGASSRSRIEHPSTPAGSNSKLKFSISVVKGKPTDRAGDSATGGRQHAVYDVYALEIDVVNDDAGADVLRLCRRRSSRRRQTNRSEAMGTV